MGVSTKISLGIDARVLFRKNLRGIGRYLKNIVQLSPQDFEIVLYGEKEFENEFSISIPNNVKIKTFNLKGYRFQTWEQIGLPFHMVIKKHNLFFSPANTVPLIQPCKTVITLHDAHLWLSRDHNILNWYYLKLVPRALKKVDYVITISHFSKEELLKIFPFLQNRIEVIYHGIEPIFKPNIPFFSEKISNNIKVKKPYLLYIGGESSKKQPNFMLELFAKIQKKFPHISLIMLGISENARDRFYAKAKNKYNIQYGLFISPPVSDDVLAMLYSNATAVLYPTLHEGFGFPILEAMASKVPILASNVASIPEISGNYAFLLSPNNVLRWEQLLIDIINNRYDLNNSQLESAHNWAKKFSWQMCVNKTYEVFRKIVRGN